MTYYYLPKMFAAEHESAAYLSVLLKKGVDKTEASTEGLSKLQPMAVENACKNPLSILTGPPGTGKTTTIKRIVDSFQKAGLSNGIISCPTGKAAKRAYEVVNFDEAGNKRAAPIEAVTTHRLLKFSGGDYGGGFTYNFRNQLPYDFVIVDEFPMMDASLFNSFLSSVKPGKTRIVLSGDQYQLPAVGAGNIARDLISSGIVPTVELDHIFRQGANSGIVFNANRILHGESICKIDPRSGEEFQDFFFVNKSTEDETYKTIIEYICEKIPAKLNLNARTDIQALSPGKKAKVGTKSLNDALREKLTTGKQGKLGFRVGDKVINRVNNYDLGIMNGDVGVVKEFTADSATVDFGPGTGEIIVKGDALASLHLAYCYTVHSSQGSEYAAVVIPLHKCHYQLLFRNMLYTGITRGKQLAVVVGDPYALSRCIKNNSAERRVTGFLSAIRKYCC